MLKSMGRLDDHVGISRREWLGQAGVAAAAFMGGSLLPQATLHGAPDSGKKVRVAAVFTEFSYRSHAHVILENFLKPYLFCGKLIEPPVEVISLWGDQFPEKEMSHQV